MFTRRTHASRAFTLIEVLLVILIIGMLAGVLVVTIGGQREGAQIDTTELKVKKVANKLEEFNLNVGRYPTSDEGLDALIRKPAFDDETTGEKWRGPYLQSVDLKDAWNRTLNYEATSAAESPGGVGFRVWSNGPDGQSNTADDIRYPAQTEGE